MGELEALGSTRSALSDEVRCVEGAILGYAEELISRSSGGNGVVLVDNTAVDMIF